MNDLTVEHPSKLVDSVATYVREVRAQLADLSAEEIDDLTSGMEADLSELAAESGGDLIGRLGSPMRYAAELRAAAGLPDRVVGPARRRGVAEALPQARAWFTVLTEQRPWLAATAAFLVTLRPAWWLLRGYLAAWALWSFLGGMRGLRPHGATHLAMALVAIVVSVQIGRGWLRQWAGLRPLLVLANTVAVVVALVASTSGVTSGETSPDVAYASPIPGMVLDGAQVSNIYAYDSGGRRITGVRLYDQDGRPLNGDQSSVGANQPTWSPPVSIAPLLSSPSATARPTSPVTGTPPAPAPQSPRKSISTKAPTAKPVAPKRGSPRPSSVPRPSVTRSGG